MKHILLAGCALALILGGSAAAQQSATSGSNSGASSGSISGVVNGGSSANNGGVTVGSQTTGPSTSNSNSSASSTTASGAVAAAKGGDSAATNQGNAQSITFNNAAPPDKLETVPQVYAPALTTTLTETCMGSSSGGASAMGWGASFGTSWRDNECVRRLDAREIEQLLGDREAARAILCGSKDVYDAYEKVGRPCPQSPEYNPANAQAYLPQPPAPPPPPPPPVVVNVPAPAPQAQAAPPADFQMAPVPNPVPMSAPSHVHHRHHSPAQLCPRHLVDDSTDIDLALNDDCGE